MRPTADMVDELSRHFATDDVSQHLVSPFGGNFEGILRSIESLGAGDPIA
jgi:hypothetical protein